MAKRRQNGEGTIYQRPNGLWVCELTLGYDKDKKRIRKVFSSMDLDRLKKKLNDAKYLKDRNLVKEASHYTLSEWLDVWLETYKKDKVKPTTFDMYYRACNSYLKPNLGHYKLDKLNPLVVQRFINEISKKGISKCDGLSVSSIKKILITLSQAYSQAVKLNMLYKNPCSDIVMPNKQPRQAVAFTADEQERFLSLCGSDTTYENMFLFAFNTGMRLGEIIALTWKDINFDDKTVSVNKNLVEVYNYDETAEHKKKTIINSSTKNGESRVIPLNKKALAAVMNQKANCKVTTPFVFYSSAGTAVQKRNIYRSFHRIRENAEITSPVSFHSMRHSFATRLLEKGADIKTVSTLLGHRSIQITLDIYSHVHTDLKKQTIALLD
mgnify:CR=1 FL=1